MLLAAGMDVARGGSGDSGEGKVNYTGRFTEVVLRTSQTDNLGYIFSSSTILFILLVLR
jgi:hypothetical protein